MSIGRITFIPNRLHYSYLLSNASSYDTGDGLLDITISTLEGRLFLAISASIIPGWAMEGATLNFRGSNDAVNKALSGLVYQARFITISAKSVLVFGYQIELPCINCSYQSGRFNRVKRQSRQINYPFLKFDSRFPEALLE